MMIRRKSSRSSGVMQALLEHVPQKWVPVLRKRTCSNKEIEQDDDSKKSHSALAAAVVMLATWDAWRWYFVRVSAVPEEALALLLTAVLLGLLAIPRQPPPAPARVVPLPTIAFLLAVYAASAAFLPPIVRTGIAAIAVLFALYFAAFRERPPLALCGLTALAL